MHLPPTLSWSWTVLLPSDTQRRSITCITAVLLPLVTYLLTLTHIFSRNHLTVCDRISYIILRCHWCDITVLNVHAPKGDKIDDMKDSFYVELELVLNKDPKYHIKILLWCFSDKVGRKDIFKPTVGNEGLHEISIDNRVRVASFAISKNLTVKRTMFPIVIFINLLGHLLTERLTIILIIFW
jgi:hypothetical protein